MTRSVVLVGGGLANCLLGLRLRALRPDVSLTLVESSSCLGGQHTWSFHGTDVAPETGAWLLPLASYSWPHHSVRFPERRRRLTGSYHSLTSEHLHEVVMRTLSDRVRLDAPVVAVAAHLARPGSCDAATPRDHRQGEQEPMIPPDEGRARPFLG